MRTIFILLFGLVFLAGSALAQNNEATILQNGDNYQATINQTGSSNDAIIDQASSGGSLASIDQVGNNNVGDVYWRNTSGHGGGEIIIIQEGDLNEAYHRNFSFAPAYQNDKIYQYGNENYAYQRYRGGTTPSSDAEIFQGQAGNPGDLNEAIQDLGGANAKIEQYGSSNIARQYNTGTSGQNGYQHANIKQEGDGNDADVSAAAPYEPFDNTVDFDFDAAGPLPVSQYQTGSAASNAFTNIYGNYNHTTQWQTGGGNSATIDIGQAGTLSSDNTAQQIQLNGNNDATISIEGDLNIASQYQDGGHISTITVNGDNNLAIVHQTN